MQRRREKGQVQVSLSFYFLFFIIVIIIFFLLLFLQLLCVKLDYYESFAMYFSLLSSNDFLLFF